MRCSIEGCNSDSHFRAECPLNPQNQRANASSWSRFVNAPPASGPLGDLLAPSASAANSVYMVSPAAGHTAQPAAETSSHSPIPSLPRENTLQGIWIPPAGTPAATPEAFAYAPTGETIRTPWNLSPNFELEWAQRMQTVTQGLASGVPQPVLQASTGNHLDQFPQLMAFRELGAHRMQHDRWQATRPPRAYHPQPAWESIGDIFNGPATAGPPVAAASAAQLPQDYQDFAANMLQHQTHRLTELRDERAIEQQTRARVFAEQYAAAQVDQRPTPDVDTDNECICQICLDTYIEGELVSILACTHKFHSVCIDTWCAFCVQNGNNTTCPFCRREVDVVSDLRMEAEPAAEYPDNASETFQSVASSSAASTVFPWWPVSGQDQIVPLTMPPRSCLRVSCRLLLTQVHGRTWSAKCWHVASHRERFRQGSNQCKHV